MVCLLHPTSDPSPSRGVEKRTTADEERRVTNNSPNNSQLANPVKARLEAGDVALGMPVRLGR